jgi:hypothetical protein
MATRRPPPGMETLARSDWLLRLGRGACGLPGDTLRRAWAWHPGQRPAKAARVHS